MVFQEFALFPWRTVQANVEFGLEEAGVPAARAARERARRYIEHDRARAASRASTRTSSRAACASAWASRARSRWSPAVLLMDEPFSALDAQTRTLMQEELLGIWERTRKTILYVTHNIQEAVFMADRVIVLSRRPGRVLDDGADRARRARAPSAMLGEPAFVQAGDRIWALIKSQAQAALLEATRGVSAADAADRSVDDRTRVPRAAASTASLRVARAGRACVVLWELVTRIGLGARALPAVAARRAGGGLRTWRVSGELSVPPARRASSAWPAGFAIGALAGVSVGVAVGFFSLAEAVGTPLIAATFPIPKIALLPLLILWLGIGEAVQGGGDRARRVLPDGDQHLRGRAPGRSAADPGRRVLRRGAVERDPQGHAASALPMVFAGLRLGAGTALLLLVAAEMIAADSGIGFLVLHAGNLMETTKLMVGIVVLSLLGVALALGLSRGSSARSFRWRHT